MDVEIFEVADKKSNKEHFGCLFWMIIEYIHLNTFNRIIWLTCFEKKGNIFIIQAFSSSSFSDSSGGFFAFLIIGYFFIDFINTSALYAYLFVSKVESNFFKLGKILCTIILNSS